MFTKTFRSSWTKLLQACRLAISSLAFCKRDCVRSVFSRCKSSGPPEKGVQHLVWYCEQAFLVSLQVPTNAARDFVCQALLTLITNQNAEGKTPIAHLLLEAVPPNDGLLGSCDKAAHLFSVCCCAEHARLAVKVCKQTGLFSWVHWYRF